MTNVQKPVVVTGGGLGKPGLKRQIGFIGLIWASTGSIIGSGWLFGAQKALGVAGPAAIISWVIGGIVILILALVHAELGGMYPIAGGTARFPHFAFGGVAGASFGWFSWLQAVTVSPIEVEAMITYSQHYSFAHGWLNAKTGILTGTGIVIAVILMALITGINFLSVRALSHTNSAATWWKIGVPVLTILILAIFSFHGSNFHAANGFAPEGVKSILTGVSSGGIIFALLGFEQADQLAGESKNPKKDIPRAVIGSVIIGVVIYLALQIVFLGALPANLVHGTWAGAAFNTLTGPFAQVATLAGFGWLAVILYIDAIISPAGTGLIYVTATSRVSFGLSRNGYFPQIFERTNRRGVPWFGLIIAFIVGCICFAPFPSWQSLVGLITSASVLMYAGAPLALGAFRRRLPDADRPYRMPAASVMAPLAFIFANFIILWTGWVIDWKLGVAVILGFLLLWLTQVFNLNPVKPQFNWKSAQWIPVYLIGLGLIVFLSDFGPLSHPWFPLYWDMGVTAAFSLVIYYWAQQVALPAEAIQEVIDTVVLPEEQATGIKLT